MREICTSGSTRGRSGVDVWHHFLLYSTDPRVERAYFLMLTRYSTVPAFLASLATKRALSITARW